MEVITCAQLTILLIQTQNKKLNHAHNKNVHFMENKKPKNNNKLLEPKIYKNKLTIIL